MNRVTTNLSRLMICPVCKAENSEGPQCRRCRADLALLFRLEDQRRGALTEAYRSAARGDWTRALAITLGADALRGDDESRRLLAVAHLMKRDFGRAFECYHSLSRGTPQV